MQHAAFKDLVSSCSIGFALFSADLTAKKFNLPDSDLLRINFFGYDDYGPLNGNCFLDFENHLLNTNIVSRDEVGSIEEFGRQLYIKTCTYDPLWFFGYDENTEKFNEFLRNRMALTCFREGSKEKAIIMDGYDEILARYVDAGGRTLENFGNGNVYCAEFSPTCIPLNRGYYDAVISVLERVTLKLRKLNEV